MLILSRKVGEKIRIGNDITITAFSINEKKIQLGITAPENIPVHREEIYRKIQSQNNPDQKYQAKNSQKY